MPDDGLGAADATRRGEDLPFFLFELWRNGERPHVGDFLVRHGSVDPALLVAVLRVDQQQRWLAGERVLAESYFARFPELRDDPDQAVELIYCELLVREELRERPALGEYLERFPVYRERLEQQLRLHAALGDEQRATPATQAALKPTVRASEDNPSTASPIKGCEPISIAVPGYDLIREIGRGGMGIVFEAREQPSGRTVALKIVQSLDPGSLYRFKQEFRALAGLSHPNLIALYNLVADAQPWFFTMELLDGQPFLDYVGGPIPCPLSSRGEPRLRAGLAQLADGVNALHAVGRLHRDIKPSNVMVTKSERVVLLDFGLVAQLDPDGRHLSLNPRLLGTIAYMAPEQAACEPVSPASDWYSVGVMLFEALTGRLPFEGPAFSILMEKQAAEAPAPQDLAPDLPEDLCRLCSEMLRRDPVSRPSGAEVRQQLGATVSHQLGSQSLIALPEGQLVGRRDLLRRIHEAFELTRRGKTVVVSLFGRSGSGKTALLRAFLEERAKTGGAVVLSGRCYEQESVPYKALDSLVDALSRYLESLPRREVEPLLPRDVRPLARLFPVLRQIGAVAGAPSRAGEAIDQREVRRRAMVALREMFARMGDRSPLVLAIDDLQWGDEDSAAVLAELLRAPDPPVLLLVASYRSEDIDSSPCLRAFRLALAAETDLEHIDLPVEPLGDQERKELALALLGNGADSNKRAETIARQSGGYPFFIHELARFIRNDPGLPSGGPAGDVTLNGVLWQRIQGLPPPARRLLEVVAVAGRPIAAKLAYQASVIEGVTRMLPLLRSQRLMRSSAAPVGEMLETYHDRVRETVVLNLASEAQADLHRRLAFVLETTGTADPEWRAVHYLGAGETQVAVRYLVLGADRAAEALAFDRAIRLFRQALALDDRRTASEESSLRTRLGNALAGAGQGAAAAREYLAATAGAAPDDALELQRRAALRLLSSGHIDDGMATLRQVLASVGLSLFKNPTWTFVGVVWQRLLLRLRGLKYRSGEAKTARREPRPPDVLRRLDVMATAAIGLSMVDTVQGAYFQTRALRLALWVGEPTRLVSCLALEAAHESIGGTRNRKRTEALLDAAEKLARELGEPYPLGMVAAARGTAAALQGDWQGALSLCDLAAGIFREHCKGVMWELGTVHRFALWPLMYLGRLQELRRRLPDLIKEARQGDDLYEETNLCLVIRTMVRLADDEPERARRELSELMSRWSHQGFHVQHMNRLFDDTSIDLYEGRVTEARTRLIEAWPLVERSKILLVQQVRVFLRHLRARTALATDAFDEARTDVRALDGEGAAWAAALARLLGAGVANRSGNKKRAQVLLREGAGRCEDATMPLYAAAARWWLGGQERERGEALMREQGVVRPERMAALLIPGLGE